MTVKKTYLLLLAAVLSLTVLPAAAAEIPAGVSEYMARFAAGKLYLPYYEAESAEEEPSESGGASKEEASAVVSESSADVSSGKDEEAESPRAVAVEAVNLSRLSEGERPELLLMNETSYVACPRSAADTPLTIGKGAVLILHTHGTEAYLDDGADSYEEGESFRSTDKKKNVVAVGEVFAGVLKDAGIETYHDTEMYDEKDFANSYNASRAAAKKFMQKNPRVRYIIDIHRDAVFGADGKAKKTACRAEGKDCAQVMLVVGTDEAGAAHSDWRSNFCVASKYQLNAYPMLARPVYLRKASFNQQLCRGCMLLEIGSGANTLPEAKFAAKLAAECFVKLYEELSH